MQEDQIIKKVVDELQKISDTAVADELQKISDTAVADSDAVGLTEFVGTAFGDTIGVVIANVDESLHEELGLDKKYHSLGIVSSRTGAGPQIMACDEAIKASNAELLMFELPRDTKGGGGHGSLAVFGAEDVSDARRAVEITLKTLSWTFGDIYMNDAGFCELQYTARASYAISKYFKAPLGRAWGLVVGCPAAVGMLMADTAVKAANVELLMHASPAVNTSHTNEFMIMISGDSGAVKMAVITAREVGKKLLCTMGDPPQSLQVPYIR